MPSGCHEAAVRAGMARDEEEGDGIEFSKNLRLVRGSRYRFETAQIVTWKKAEPSAP